MEARDWELRHSLSSACLLHCTAPILARAHSPIPKPPSSLCDKNDHGVRYTHTKRVGEFPLKAPTRLLCPYPANLPAKVVAQPKLLHDNPIATDVLVIQIRQVAPSLSYQLEQASA